VNSVTWNGAVWIACADTAAFTSTDGINWTANTSASKLFKSTMLSVASRRFITSIKNMLGGTDTTDASGVKDIELPTSIFGGLSPIVTATIVGETPYFISVNITGITTFRISTFNTSGTAEAAFFNWQAINP
jgi:hypothetical protein